MHFIRSQLLNSFANNPYYWFLLSSHVLYEFKNTQGREGSISFLKLLTGFMAHTRQAQNPWFYLA